MTSDNVLCGNCGSDKHKRCCARCGVIIRRKEMREIGFCTRRCQKEQDRDDEGSMRAQCIEDYGEDYWDTFGAGGHKQ